ncbi:MAG: ATP-binding protein [Solirubrobacterales bacterium]|nr:ATP-binding protein [Solirubrobacterales bacterium]
MAFAPTAIVLDAVYPARAPSVAAVRHAVTVVATQSGADEEALMRINLAVSEAVTNAVVHAYRDGARPGEVRVVATPADGALEVSVRDTGVGMSPRPDSPGLGRGVGLMHHAAQRCEVRLRPEGGTEVALSFALRPGGA